MRFSSKSLLRSSVSATAEFWLGDSIMKNSFSLLFCVPFLVCGQFASADSIISDSDFVDADWAATSLFQVSSSSQAQQVATGGNSDQFRQTTHMLNPDTSQERVAILYHGFLSGAYNPMTQGGISSIDYSVDRIVINPPFVGSQVGHRPALMQNGVVFTTISSPLNFASTSWTSGSQLNLTESDFVDALSLAQFGGDGTHFSPDFSGSGGSIQFGYFSGNTSPASNLLIVTNHGVDNWSYSITSIPEPSTAAFIGLSMLAGLIHRRKSR